MWRPTTARRACPSRRCGRARRCVSGRRSQGGRWGCESCTKGRTLGCSFQACCWVVSARPYSPCPCPARPPHTHLQWTSSRPSLSTQRPSPPTKSRRGRPAWRRRGSAGCLWRTQVRGGLFDCNCATGCWQAVPPHHQEELQRGAAPPPPIVPVPAGFAPLAPPFTQASRSFRTRPRLLLLTSTACSRACLCGASPATRTSARCGGAPLPFTPPSPWTPVPPMP